MNARDILFRTHRFNLSVRKPHFINPDCFGEDLGSWLNSKLIERGVDVPHSGQEDWGWYLKVRKGKDSYLLGMNGIPDETVPGKPDLGEWRIIVKKNRSLGQWLSGKGHIAAADPMLVIIEEILGAEADFSDVHQEDETAVTSRSDSKEGKIMSFDLGVWYPQNRIGKEEARELYVRLCNGDASGVVPHPAIDAFYAELIARHPEIDTIPEEKIDDHDYSPWSCKLDRSPSHVIMSCVWPKATYVHQLVQNLARKHGLAVYDPQSDEVTYPDGTTTRAKPGRVSLWILGSFALLFGAIFIYSGRGSSSGVPLVLYVFAGLCVLMAAACFRQAWR